MSEKIWKIFGIFGMICLVGILIWIFFGTFGKLTKNPRAVPSIGYGLEKISTLPEQTKQTEFQISSRMIIKTGWLNLVVKDIVDSAKKISKFAEEKGGWVVSSNIYESENMLSGSVTVRVPAEKFEEAKDYFKSLAERVTSERTEAQDITEEYVDLEARLRNLEAAETQLLDLMKRAGKISEILEVQRELTNVRKQIEQIKGRMQYLEQSVKMASITVNLALSEELLPIPPAEKWRPRYVLLETWKSVLGFWKGFSYFLIRVIVWAQVWVPALILIFVLAKVLKKKKNKESA
ncbi:DUF4349 domain-containing protein [Candidatus Parcubacteria bacterium]|nr:DUF4349 domain-containing protein [Candidatus Parcubacteria bacterium]